MTRTRAGVLVWACWAAAMLAIVATAHAEEPKASGTTVAKDVLPVCYVEATHKPCGELTDAQLRDYFRALSDVQAAQAALTTAQTRLDAAARDLQATCGDRGIAQDAKAGYACGKPTEPPKAEKAK